ncbi:hypothetical protein GCM10017674_44230 [Streptomyces gardneri]|uniref:Uncharacterized protein n=1 Tax=Streptomyces gardneri TaxID=66892 RepID=A0A4Y3RP26_9ACTN|nr:hypothetical protein SGA01_51310 [Streptomyces gardneri]GHH05176.1 hypothetical protein GCM10017674_44230 [Streptomyces gardneri]
MGGPEGGQQGVLEGVGGLLAVSQRAQGHRPQTVAMTPHKLTEGVRVPGDMARQELLVACGLVYRSVQR